MIRCSCAEIALAAINALREAENDSLIARSKVIFEKRGL
jgi:hypothetical protein